MFFSALLTLNIANIANIANITNIYSDCICSMMLFPVLMKPLAASLRRSSDKLLVSALSWLAMFSVNLIICISQVLHFELGQISEVGRLTVMMIFASLCLTPHQGFASEILLSLCSALFGSESS